MGKVMINYDHHTGRITSISWNGSGGATMVIMRQLYIEKELLPQDFNAQKYLVQFGEIVENPGYSEPKREDRAYPSVPPPHLPVVHTVADGSDAVPSIAPRHSGG